jgi:hypothetical protein
MNDEKPKGLIERLELIDRRVIFVLVGLAIILPLFTGWRLELRSTPPVTDFYRFLQDLPPGSKIVISDDWDPGSKAELETAAIAVLRHAFKRDLKVIEMTLWGTGAIIVNDTLEKTAQAAGKVYGEDYVSLGFKEGREVIMQGVAQNIRTVYPTDYRGNDIDDLPIMDGVNSLRDVAGVVSVSAGYPGTKEWVQQVQTRFNIPMIAICAGVSEPEYQPSYNSGLLQGLICCLANMAAYEDLVGDVGFATRAMVAQSSGHYMLAALIILGNLFYAIARRRVVLTVILAVGGGGFYLSTLIRILTG